jgi:hypothetical protein
MGFNIVFFDGGADSKAELDRIWEAGLYVWYRPPGQLCGNFQELKRVVSTFGRHPAVLFWEIDDEPILNGANWEAAAIGCEVVRRVDPFHPVLCNQWYSGRESIADLQRWASLADVHGFGCYPVPLSRWGERMRLVEAGWPHSIAVVGSQLDLWRSVAPTKPVIPVLQAYACNALEDGEAGFPTRDQARFMAYLAVVRGANGLHHFGVPDPRTPHLSCGIPPAMRDDLAATHADFVRTQQLNQQFWQYYAEVVREIGVMGEVFAASEAGWSAPDGTIETESCGGAVEVRVKRPDAPVVLVTNSAAAHDRISLLVGPLAAARLHVWGEGRTLDVTRDGVLTDTIGPFGVRVYSPQPDPGVRR